jgi:hypothetical protein
MCPKSRPNWSVTMSDGEETFRSIAEIREAFYRGEAAEWMKSYEMPPSAEELLCWIREEIARMTANS